MGSLSAGVVDALRRLWPGKGEPLDGTRVLLAEGEALFRFAWLLEYRSGLIRQQYERHGEAVFQTLASKIDRGGVRRILAYDLLATLAEPVAFIDVPEDAEVLLFHRCRFIVETGITERAAAMGWTRGHAERYLMLFDPHRRPPRIWEETTP